MFSSLFYNMQICFLCTAFGSKVQAQEIFIHRITIRKQDMLSRGRMRIQRVWLNWNVEESFEKEKKKVKASIEKKTWENIFAIAFWTLSYWKEYSVTEINFQIPITNPKKFNESICLNGMSAILRKSPFHTIEISTAYFYNGWCESIVII